MKNILESKIYIDDLDLVLKNFDFSGLKNKTVLVTGGLGLIGSAIVDIMHFGNEKYGFNTKIIVGARSEEKFNNRYNFSDITFLQYDALKSFSINEDIDFIIHAASIASPEIYVQKPVETYLTNFNGLFNLLEYCKQHTKIRIIYISSSEVYGKRDSIGAFSESDYGVVAIDDVRASYGVAKRASEMLCKCYNKEYGVNSVIIRPGHIFGPTASIQDKKVSSEFAYFSAAGKDLELKSAGLQKRSYCYSLDCGSAIICAMLFGADGESYNIGHSEVTSIKEMANYMADAGRVKLKAKEPTEEELKAFNPMANSVLDIAKISNIGFHNLFSVKDACLHTVKILKEIL